MEVETSLTLPGWSKTGRRTRGARVGVDDHEGGDVERESLPPKKRKLDSRDLISPRKQHRCNLCCRSFSSYQALGGHKAHHNARDHRKADEVVNGGDDDAVVDGGVHKCTLCYKVFSKGQALGGHRRHCQRPAVIENGVKVFSFDLNELPPESSFVKSKTF